MHRQSEVPAQAAYAAAEERAIRTTKALILAEAQILTLRGEVARLEREVGRKEAEIVDLGGRAKCDPEGGDDGGTDADPVGYTAAVGQAD